MMLMAEETGGLLSATAGTELPSVEEAVGWTGAKVDAGSGGSVGRVEGILIDSESGEPHWVVARIGRFGHHTAIPFSHVVAGVGRVWAPYERDLVRRAPRVHAGRPLTRESELELCDFYGIGDESGRGAEIADRPEGAETARPAGPSR